MAAQQDNAQHGQGALNPHLAGAAESVGRDAGAGHRPGFIGDRSSQAFASAAAFENKFGDWCKQAGLEPVLCADGQVRSYRAHGLRKAACKALAHAGCTGPEIMAVGGHRSLAQVQVYIDGVEQGRMAEAAMEKLAARKRTASD